jgi:hypothetical protein
MRKSSGPFGVPPGRKGKEVVAGWNSVVSFCTPA